MATVDILGIGECMIQLDAQGSLAESEVFNRYVGGDVYNTLVAASRLGSKTAFLSRVALDGFGEVLLRHFVENKVESRLVEKTVSGYNGLYFTAIKPDGRHEFVYYRYQSAASHIGPSHIKPKIIADTKIVYATGVTQAISTSCRQAVLKAFTLAKEQGTTVVYDPNYRSSLWKHRDEAMAAFIEVLPFVDLILPSFEDMRDLFDFEDATQIMEYFRYREVPVVVLKQGSEGARLMFKQQDTVVPAVLVEQIQDTIGAGDAFNGGFLHGLLQERSLLACAEMGTQVAASSLKQAGPIQGLPRWTQLTASV